MSVGRSARVDVDARHILRADIPLAGKDGEVSRPALVEHTRAVVFPGIEHAIAILIVAKEQLRRHAFNHQQFFDAVERTVLGHIGRTKAGIVVALGAVFAQSVSSGSIQSTIELATSSVMFGSAMRKFVSVVPLLSRAKSALMLILLCSSKAPKV